MKLQTRANVFVAFNLEPVIAKGTEDHRRAFVMAAVDVNVPAMIGSRAVRLGLTTEADVRNVYLDRATGTWMVRQWNHRLIPVEVPHRRIPVRVAMEDL